MLYGSSSKENHILKLKKVDSTNEHIKRYPELWEKQFQTVYTFNQTRGRGRNGRSWISKRGQDIAFSTVFHIDEFKESFIPAISLFTAIAVQKVLEEYSKKSIHIKWPNDIQFKNKKMAGILCEPILSIQKKIVILGVGVNVNSNEFPEDIANKTTSLRLIMGKEIDLETLFYELLTSIQILLEKFTVPIPKKIHECLLSAYPYTGKKVDFLNQNMDSRKGRIIGIDNYGFLVIKELKTEKIYKLSENVFY